MSDEATRALSAAVRAWRRMAGRFRPTGRHQAHVVRRILDAGSRAEPRRLVEFTNRFDLELERARRQERSFSLTRFDWRGDGGMVEVEQALRSWIRQIDAMVVVGGEVIVMWSETPRQSAEEAAALLSARVGLPLRTVRTVSFPEDGFTRFALMSELFAGVSSAGGRSPDDACAAWTELAE